MTAPASTPQSTLAALKGSMPPMRRPALSQERPRARRRPCLLLALLPTLLAGPQPAALAGSTDLEASYRFLTSDRAAGGILYTATAGKLQGRRLPLSFYDSAAYWGEHVCAAADCAVVDVYNPHTYTLTPAPSVAGDLQTERVNTHNGANIYDAAAWQIAVMLGRAINGLSAPTGEDVYALASNQNMLLREGHSGDSSHPTPNEIKAVTAGSVFVYNGQRVDDPRRAYSFRMTPRSWLSKDPFAGTPYSRHLTLANPPADNKEYQPGKVSWTDWKPITGENSWALLLGPLQAAALHYQIEKKSTFVPFHDPALGNALAMLPTFAAMQSSLGAVYYAPAGTVANQGDQLVDPYFVAVENNISLYAGLQVLQSVLQTTLRQEKGLSPTDRASIEAALQLSGAMIHGGNIGTPDKPRASDGLLAFFKNAAWRDGEFVQGGRADAPGAASRWQPSLETKAVDVNTWGIAALGGEQIDAWFGFGAGYRNWSQVKRWGGYGKGTTLWGVGFSDQDGNGIDPDGNFRQGVLSVEWTAGAVTMVRSLIAHYQAIADASPNYAQARQFVESLRQDEQSMLAAMETLRADTYASADFNGKPNNYNKLLPLSTKPYLYASKRYFIPFGWYANPLPSTCATAWMIMIKNNYNPFLPGGGLEKNQ
ncbi:hypothetical protein [Desulfobulbus sp.]|uniref:hypothetical protein n=1 Tax=Desulfobulbus sp. TaxID=895 RepID=UPI0027B93FFB|nr:hypothetical protein [Desulfobulbus sp.]